MHIPDPIERMEASAEQWADDYIKGNMFKCSCGRMTEEQVNGTDEQKNSLTIYEWDNLPHQIRYDNKLGYRYASNGGLFLAIHTFIILPFFQNILQK